MTIGPVDLAEIQQTLTEMQSPSSAAVGPESADFATSLAQATGDLGGTGDAALLAEALDGDSGGLSSTAGSDSGLDLVALLLSAEEGGGTAAAPLGGQGGSGDVTGQDVVNEASQFEGTPYVWGGTSPQGFDCSGLVQYVYGQLGVQLPPDQRGAGHCRHPGRLPGRGPARGPRLLRRLGRHGRLARSRGDLPG